MSRAEDLFALLVQEGAARVEQMISSEETEELFLDYKRSADEGRGARLADDDKRSLAKAISGFGNSEGGVIVWGVDCCNEKNRGDVPTGAHPIHQPNRFKSRLEQVVSGSTVPAHGGVRHEALPIGGTEVGFVVTLIPKGSHAPYQTVPDLRYLMRSGSNFAPVPHAVLAGMFGRRPQPDVFFYYILSADPQRIGKDGLSIDVNLALSNSGPGIASDAYLNVAIINLGGSRVRAIFDPTQNDMWVHSGHLGTMWTSVLRQDHRFPPDAMLVPLRLNFNFCPPITTDFKVRLSCGADGAVSYRRTWHVPSEELGALLQDALITNGPDIAAVALRRLVDRLLSTEG